MERRGYPKFKAFNDKILELMKDRSGSVYFAYKDIIKAMKEIK